MKFLLAFLSLLVATGGTPGLAWAQSDRFEVGIYGDDERAIACVTAEVGAVFEQVVWAWVPDELGLAYITLRFDFPENLDFNIRPVFNDLVSGVIFSDYTGGTVEWNMIFDGCPSGWVKVFSQQCVVLAAEPARIIIQGADSMMRDCDFILNDVLVRNEFTINDPACETVSAVARPWRFVKSMYR